MVEAGENVFPGRGVVATQGEAPGGDQPKRLEAAQRGHDDERREPGQDRNPRGGRPYKRAYGEPEPKAQSNFTESARS